MLRTIKQFFTPPVFPDDEDKTRTARVLYALFASIMGVLLLLTLANIFLFVAKTIISILLIVLLIWILVSRALAQSGKITLASQVFVSGLWILTTIQLLLSGQLATATTAFHVSNLAIAGVLLGRRSAITLAVMSSLVGLGMVILEVTGHPLHHYVPNPPIAYWITWVIAFAMTITPLNLTIQSAAQALVRARKSERRFATLFNEAPMMYLTIRDEGGNPIIMDCNAAFFKNLGYRREQVIGQSLVHFYTPQSRLALLEDGGFQRALQNEIKTPIERELVAKNGYILHALVRTAPEIDESGQSIGVLAMYLDITERKRTSDISEARLRLMQFASTHLSEELLQATLDEVEALTGSSIGFYHFLDADQRTLILQAWSTNTLKNMCKSKGKGSHYDIDQAGIWVECVHERRPVIHNDYPALPASRRKGMPEGHAPVTRELVVPVFRGDKIVSILGVGNKPHDYDQNDIEIVSRLADMAWDIAERKQTEERTAKERENFLKIFAASPVGLVLLDQETVITKANPSLSEIVLRDPVDILGKRAGGGLGCINSLEDPKGCGFGRDCPNCVLRQGIKKILVDGQSIHGVEVELALLINGKLQPRWLSIGAESLELDGKQHVVVAIDDVTQRKQAEEALRTSNQLLESTFASLRDAVFIIDVKTAMIKDCNPAATAIFGYSRADMLGNATMFLHVDQAVLAEFRKLLSSAMAEKGFLFLSEFKMKRKDGTVFPTEHTVLPLQDERGQQIGWVSVVRDITEGKQAEQALQESEEKYRYIVENAPMGIFRRDLEGKFQYINPCLIGQLKCKTEKEFLDNYGLISQRWACPERNDELTALLIENRKVYDYEIESRLVDGTTKWFALYLFLDNSDQFINGFSLDITARKQAEKEKEKLREQFTQAQKMESVGRLAGGVAHDFNNMLGVIIGYSEMILEQVTPSQQFHPELEEIRKAARRSADLTRQLLTFARKQTVSPQVLDLNQTIEGMLNMLRRLIGENIYLIWMPGTGLWLVKIDPSQVDQILANLCVNARDAIAGVGKITVETENAIFDEEYCANHAGSLPGEYVRIALSDTGNGMDKETLAHIFEPFFTTKGVGEGTGLGLATVYGAVKQNNGFINVYSEPGHGTTFSIYIPHHIEKTTQTLTTDSVKPVLRGDEIIMLVEDEPTLLGMSKTILERLGYTVLTAGTPREAIRLAGEYSGQINLLVTDVIMPEMNGRELAECFMESRPEMKHLFMSGYTTNIIAKQGGLQEGVTFIQKPFSKNELAAKVRAALES